MAGKRTGIVEGKDIMVYVDPAGGNSFKPTAAATSHKISYKAETKTNKRVTKDADASKWDNKQVTGMSCSISISCLVDATDNKLGYAAMLNAFKKGQAVKAKYSFTSEQNGDSYEEGMFVIASIDQDAPVEGDGTWSATLESSGEIATKTVSGIGG